MFQTKITDLNAHHAPVPFIRVTSEKFTKLELSPLYSWSYSVQMWININVSQLHYCILPKANFIKRTYSLEEHKNEWTNITSNYVFILCTSCKEYFKNFITYTPKISRTSNTLYGCAIF